MIPLGSLFRASVAGRVATGGMILLFAALASSWILMRRSDQRKEGSREAKRVLRQAPPSGGSSPGAVSSESGVGDQGRQASDPGDSSASPRDAPAARLLVPVKGVRRDDLFDTWGDSRSQGRTHQGIDIAAPRGTPVLAATAGTIAKRFESVRGGITLYQFGEKGEWSYYYAHLEGYAAGLEEGDAVSAGQLLGYVGTSGNAPDSHPHLHFEVIRVKKTGQWWGGEPINPFPVLTGPASALAESGAAGGRPSAVPGEDLLAAP